MIGYSCDCGMHHFSMDYSLDDVTCDLCGRRGREGKEELTKDSFDLYLSDLIWGWRFSKLEPLNQDGTTKKAFFGFQSGTHILEIADWFIDTISDFVSDDSQEA